MKEVLLAGGLGSRISEESVFKPKPMLKNQYGQYLLKVIDEMKEEINSNTLTHV